MLNLIVFSLSMEFLELGFEDLKNRENEYFNAKWYKYLFFILEEWCIQFKNILGPNNYIL